jgi:hypothetical protein
MSEQKKPAQRPVSFHYVVVDKNDPRPLEPTLIAVGLTRKECKDKITFDPEADHYRIRRVRSVHYEK